MISIILFQKHLATMLNVSQENVDVFTVLHSPHHNESDLLDVRFSVHNSPYWPPEELNTKLSQDLKHFERELEVDIYLINIDECLFEMKPCKDNCRNYLNKNSTPSAVYTNTSSFIGVTAVVDPLCTCHIASIVCLNGGTPVAGKCECPPGFDGPNCEELAISFQGDGYAVFPSPGQACLDSHLSQYLFCILNFNAQSKFCFKNCIVKLQSKITKYIIFCTIAK